MYKYLFEKDYKDGLIDRKLFNSVGDLLEFMLSNNDTYLFNAGFKSAEIRLYRLKLEGDKNE